MTTPLATPTGSQPHQGRRSTRLFVILLALLVVLPVSFIGTAVLLRNPIVNSEPIRDEITATLQRLTGRDIQLVGRIEIDDFPWIKIVIGPGSFGSPENFAGPPLLTWQEISARVHYSTLYEDSPLIDRIVVSGLDIDLRRDELGRDNWSDIGPLDPQGPPEAALALPGIDFRGVKLRFTDESVSKKPLATLERMTLTIDGVSRGAGPIEGAHWRVAAFDLEGFLTAVELSSMNLNGDVALRFKGLDARVPENKAPELDVKSLFVQLSPIKASLANLRVRSPSISTSVRVDPVAISAAMRIAGIESPFRDSKDILKLKDFTAKIRYDGKLLTVDEFNAHIDDTRIRGKVSLDDPIRLSIDADSVDVEKYAAALGDTGPYDPEAPLVFPGKLLQSLPLAGQIRVGKITARGANMVGVTLRLESAPKAAPTPR